MSETPQYREIPLSQGKIALVDAEDYERINQFKWYAKLVLDRNPSLGFYACRNERDSTGKRRTVRMHREVLGLETSDSRVVDHRNPTETLDNRKYNLRIATRSENARNTRGRAHNTSGFRGVGLRKSGKYQAYITVNGRQVYLGIFPTPEQAHAAYKTASQEFHGEFGEGTGERS